MSQQPKQYHDGNWMKDSNQELSILILNNQLQAETDGCVLHILYAKVNLIRYIHEVVYNFKMAVSYLKCGHMACVSQ